MSDFVRIKIGSEADVSGLDKMEQALAHATGAANQFIDSLKLGIGIDIGGKIVGALDQIPRVFEGMIRQGVAFNARISDAQVAIANVVAEFGKMNAEAAKGVAAKAMEQIIALEPKTAATLDGLVQGFMATLASAQSAGITVEQNIDLVGKFANALANANIPAEQLSQELRSIFTGNIGPDSQLAKTLQISNADVARAKEAGQMYQFLSHAVGKLGEAGDTFAVRWSTMQSAMDKALGEITKPVFDAIAKSLVALTNELSRGEVVAALEEIGVEVANIVKTGAGLLEWALKNAAALSTMAHGAVTLGVALAAFKFTELIAALGVKTAAWLRASVAVDSETAALMRNTAAQAANATAATTNAAAHGAAGVGAAAAGAAATAGGAGRGAMTVFGDAAPFAWVGTRPGSDPRLKAEFERFGAVTGRVRKGWDDFGVVHNPGMFPTGQKATMKAAIGQAGIGAAGGVGATTAAAFLVPALVAAAALAAGISIGSWLDGLITTARKKGEDARRKAAEEVSGLQARALEANSDSRGTLELDVSKAMAQAEADLGSQDEKLVKSAKARLETLAAISVLIGQQVSANDAQIDREKRLAKEAENRAKAEEAAALAKRQALAWEETRKKSVETWEDAARTQAATPAERMGAIDTRLQRKRREFATQTGVNADASTDELYSAANSAPNFATVDALLEQFKEIVALEKELSAESEKLGEAQASRNKQAGEQRTTREAALTDLHEEQTILAARVAGEIDVADELERQRTIRQQIAQLVRSGLSEAEATAAANATGELQKQLALGEKLREQKGKQGDATAELDVMKAEASGSRVKLREAKERQLFREKRKGFEEAGFLPVQADSMARDAVDSQRTIDRRADRRIDGAGRLSRFDTMSNLADSPSRDFRRLRPLSDVLPITALGAPGAVGPSPANAHDDTGGNGSGGSDKVKAGADAVKTGSDRLGMAGDQLSAAAKQLENKVVGALNTTTATLDNVVGAFAGLERQLAAVAAKVERLNSQQSSR